jgi:hypothetical protein
MHMQADNGLWWSKPHPGDTVTLDAAGRFDYENWYVSPPTDYKFINLRFMVFPVGATVPSGKYANITLVHITTRA